MLLQSECIDVSATGRKRRWNASVWHWPQKAAQTVAAGFDHDQTLQGGHVGSGATAHRGGQGTRCHMNAAAVWMHRCIGNGPEMQVACLRLALAARGGADGGCRFRP